MGRLPDGPAPDPWLETSFFHPLLQRQRPEFLQEIHGYFVRMQSAVRLACLGESSSAKPEALNGLKLGVVIGEEEYQWPVGEGPVKTRQNVTDILPIADIKAGKFKVPPLKKLKPSNEVQDLPPAPAAKPAPTAQPSPTYDADQCPF